MSNHFTKNRVYKALGNTLDWLTSYADFSSSKDSINSLKLRSWKNTHLFQKKRFI